MRHVFHGALVPALWVAGALTAQAGELDGLYRPNYEFARNWDCSTVGQDGGALAIRGTRLIGVENSCKLKDPTKIRGMDGVLYDAVCAAEGEKYGYRLMLLPYEGGVYVITSGQVADWVRCPE